MGGEDAQPFGRRTVAQKASTAIGNSDYCKCVTTKLIPETLRNSNRQMSKLPYNESVVIGTQSMKPGRLPPSYCFCSGFPGAMVLDVSSSARVKSLVAIRFWLDFPTSNLVYSFAISS
jgi:hypothetical protein